jgi:DNA-binding NtrC family response regulator/tetratricopeptide (TPR) repeat protein
VTDGAKTSAPAARSGHDVRASEPSLGDFYLSAGDLAQAEETYVAQLATAGPRALAELWRKIGDCRERRGDPLAAEAALVEAKTAAEAADDPIEAARADLLIGKSRFHAGDLDGARRAAESARAILRDRGEVADRGLAENLLGGIAYRSGDLELARRHFEKSVYLGRQGGDMTLLARGYNNLGLIYKEMGDWDQAIDALHASLGFDATAANYDARYTAWINLGIVYQKRGEWRSAATEYRRALKHCRESGNPLGLARSLLGMAGVHRGERDFAAAEAVLEEAVALAERHGYARELALAEALRSWMAFDQDSLDVATAALDRAREAAGSLGEAGDLAPHLDRLEAHLALAGDDAAKALAIALDAGERARLTGDRYERAALARVEGEALARLGRHPEAGAAFERAVRAFRRMGERQELGHALLAWGVLPAGVAKAAAYERILEARALLAEVADHPGLVAAAMALARHYLDQGWETSALTASREGWDALSELDADAVPALRGALRDLQRSIEAEMTAHALPARSRYLALSALLSSAHSEAGDGAQARLLERVAELLQADGAALLAVSDPAHGPRGHAHRIAAAYGLRAQELRALGALIDHVEADPALAGRRLHYTVDGRGSDLFRDTPLAALRPIASAVIVRVTDSTGRAWGLYFDRARTDGRPPFGRGDLELLATLGERLPPLLARALPADRAGDAAELGLNLGTYVVESAAIHQILTQLARLQNNSIRVLLQGETGTGKGKLARILHLNSPRATRPFRVLNCATLPDTLLESELFGHVKGSFTGAIGDKIGLLEEVDGGTIFLDDIEKAGSSVQRGLLHFLDCGEIRPVGSTRSRQIDVRVICATSSADLSEDVREGRFSKDLYYRLQHFTVTVPPLRERQEDILPLARHFIARFTAEFGGGPTELAPEVSARLVHYAWPGNVRELENVIRQAVALGRGSSAIRLDLLPAALSGSGPSAPVAESLRLSELVEMFEAERVRAALTLFAGNKSRAAHALGLTRKGLRNKIRRYQIEDPNPGA